MRQNHHCEDERGPHVPGSAFNFQRSFLQTTDRTHQSLSNLTNNVRTRIGNPTSTPRSSHMVVTAAALPKVRVVTSHSHTLTTPAIVASLPTLMVVRKGLSRRGWLTAGRLERRRNTITIRSRRSRRRIGCGSRSRAGESRGGGLFTAKKSARIPGA